MSSQIGTSRDYKSSRGTYLPIEAIADKQPVAPDLASYFRFRAMKQPTSTGTMLVTSETVAGSGTSVKFSMVPV